MHGVALNLSKYRSIFPPSVISYSNLASKLGAGGGRFVFFPSNLSECPGGKSCVREIMMVRHPISQNVAFHFDLRSILNADLGESLVRGMPGWGFSCEISRNDRMESHVFERFLLLIHCMNIIILVYYDG